MNSFEMKPLEVGLLSLESGPLRLTLNPRVGGSVMAFEWEVGESRRPILRQCQGDSKNVLEAASFPLVPYVNRIRGGRFSFRGREVVLTPNMTGDPSPLHGQGWLNPWQVEASDNANAVLTYRHQAGEWPWDYEARQRFSLDDGGLTAVLVARNMSNDSMPCGLGHHPYFPCGPETRLDTGVATVWTIDEQVLPVDQVPAQGRYDLRDRLVCGQDLDNGFGGWSGEARMTDPDWPFDVRMSSADASFFQLYSPSGGGIFVAEPVTHANAALNEPESDWPQLGMRVLEPGQEMSLTMRIDVIPK